ncbi:unnamed protein product [Victoria cruziana]
MQPPRWPLVNDDSYLFSIW